MTQRALTVMAILAGVVWAHAAVAAEAVGDAGLPPYEEWRKTPIPQGGVAVTRNPPAILWPSVRRWEGRDVRYRIELADDPAFPAASTIRAEQQPCFFTPVKKLHPGSWYWRYHIIDGQGEVAKGPYEFHIRGDEPEFPHPAWQALAERIRTARPRLAPDRITTPEVRQAIAGTPAGQRTIAQARREADDPVYDGPVTSTDPAEERRLSRVAGRELSRCRSGLWGYALTGEAGLRDSVIKRLEVVTRWPTDDLLGSQVLLVLAMCHDVLGAEIPQDLHRRLLAGIQQRLQAGLKKWPGLIEGRQVENHFWQMELPGNFLAAVATLDDLPEAAPMLAYTYGLYVARFPNLATEEGGWAEGFGYLMVNQMTMVDMTLVLKRYGLDRAFERDWYRTLPEYLLYFAPDGGPSDGFGDGHERVGNNDTAGALNALIDRQTRNPFARLRAQTAAPHEEEWDPLEEPTAQAEPVAPARIERQSRVFAGVGLAALHTDVMEPAKDLAVYFRSSPFGAKGHMHANQNAVNIAHDGEKIFYSSGFYTTFSDPHSLTSYRHTRAHNTLLVNGCGQAFGHEGYGRIVSHLEKGAFRYVCGDARHAYRKTVDGQFLGLLAENGIPHDEAHGFGDAHLTRFYRHVVLCSPDLVVIYDDLAAEAASEWSILLHSPAAVAVTPGGSLSLKTARSQVQGLVLASDGVAASVTDAYHVAPVDIKKKYGEMPKAWHLTFTNQKRVPRARFLTVLDFSAGTASATPLRVEDGAQAQIAIGGTVIRAELDGDRPALMSITTADASLTVEADGAKGTPGATYRPAADGATGGYRSREILP